MTQKTTLKSVILMNDIKLDKPFSYFLATLNYLPYSKIVITDDLGNIGEGEIAHAIDINGEIQDGSSYYVPYINDALSSMTSLDSFEDVENIMHKMRLYIAHNTGLMCGIEQALFSILSQKTGKNLTDILLGQVGNNKEIFIQTTIPFQSDLEEYKNSIDKIMKNYNPKCVKLKVGKDTKLDLSVIGYLRNMNSSVSISVDANQAFGDVKKAIEFAIELQKYNVAWAEQLLHKDNIGGLRTLKEAVLLPLMVDESLHTALEAEYFAKEKLTDYFNIKLAKTGGILNALEIIKIAQAYGIKVMLGSMLHGRLGIEYNLGFALSQDFITHDFFSYFTVEETKNLGYITKELSVNSKTLYKAVKIASYNDRLIQKVIESNEEMVNISQILINCVCIHEQSEMIPYTGHDIWVRKTVAEKLEKASVELIQQFPDYRLKIVFGFRHPEVQKFYFERRKDILKPDNMHLTETELEELADTMCANPKVAGHPTGAAVDVTITDINLKRDLDMGTGISDFKDIEKIKMFYPNLTNEQRKNRDLLHEIMADVGFAQYYGEWWHFSYGDREWAYFYNMSNAIYDQIDFRTK